MLYSYSPPEHKKYQTDVALHHLIVYKNTIALRWQQAFPKPQASFWSFSRTTRTPLAHRSNKAILNSYKSNFSDVGSLCNLFFTQYFSNFVSFLLFIKVIGGGSTWICNLPVRQHFLCKTFFVVGFLFLLCLDR